MVCVLGREQIDAGFWRLWNERVTEYLRALCTRSTISGAVDNLLRPLHSRPHPYQPMVVVAFLSLSKRIRYGMLSVDGCDAGSPRIDLAIGLLDVGACNEIVGVVDGWGGRRLDTCIWREGVGERWWERWVRRRSKGGWEDCAWGFRKGTEGAEDGRVGMGGVRTLRGLGS